MAEHRSCSRRLPVAASGKTRQRAGSGSCGGGRGSTTSPSGSLPPLPPPSPAAMATRRQGDEPRPSLRSPPPATPWEGGSARPSLSPPTSYRGARPGTRQAAQAAGGGGRGMLCPEGRGSHGRQGGDVVGQSGFGLRRGWGRRENGKASLAPGRTYRNAAGRGAAAEWRRWGGGGARLGGATGGRPSGPSVEPVLGLQRWPSKAPSVVGFLRSFPPLARL